jgi:hypothetical protein
MNQKTALILETQTGTSVTLLPSPDVARRALYAFVLEWWDHETVLPLPDDAEEAIRQYFDEIVDNESYSIVEHPLSVTASEVESDITARLAAHRERVAQRAAPRYQASFDAQAWLDDYAISVDPQGDTVWECTDFLREHPELLADVNNFTDCDEYWVDDEDLLRTDPACPSWARDWPGPFTIVISRLPE